MYGHNQVTTGMPTGPEEKQEDKQQYTDRMWKLAEQAELEALKERCSKIQCTDGVEHKQC